MMDTACHAGHGLSYFAPTVHDGHCFLMLQVVLDEAAFLMDLASVDGNWDDVVDRIAECYGEAGLHDIAKFIAYRE
jgi:hypothetical protein